MEWNKTNGERMKSLQAQKINHRPDPVQIAHTNLVVAIIKQAVKVEGMDYLNSEDGRYWLDLIGIDIKRILKLIEPRLDSL